MIRKSLIGLAAAIAVTAAAASSASAGVRVVIGAPFLGGYYGPAYYGPGYYGAGYVAPCPKVFVGYRKVWNGHHWIRVPRFRRVCY